jgi:hypothetical protein
MCVYVCMEAHIAKRAMLEDGKMEDYDNTKLKFSAGCHELEETARQTPRASERTSCLSIVWAEANRDCSTLFLVMLSLWSFSQFFHGIVCMLLSVTTRPCLPFWRKMFRNKQPWLLLIHIGGKLIMSLTISLKEHPELHTSMHYIKESNIVPFPPILCILRAPLS